MIVVLPALGGDTIRPRWPLPIGDDEVDDASHHVAGLARLLKAQLHVGEQRREVFELRTQLGNVGVVPVDRVDIDDRRELLLRQRRAVRTGDPVALAEAELTDPVDRHVDVVRAGQVAIGPDVPEALIGQVEQTLDRD